jgi:hypothetical protein
VNARLVWFIAGAASAGAALAAIWLLHSPHHVIENTKAGHDFYNAFAIHGPLESDWTRVHQLGELDVWSDAEGTALAITENGRAVQLLSSGDGCCTFEIFEHGEYRAALRYGNFDERLITQDVDQDGIVWTYVDMGINGTIDFRHQPGVLNSTQQVILTQFAEDGVESTRLADHDADSGW